eukprot:6925231-Pyramimonas_sp.AAC.1
MEGQAAKTIIHSIIAIMLVIDWMSRVTMPRLGFCRRLLPHSSRLERRKRGERMGADGAPSPVAAALSG